MVDKNKKKKLIFFIILLSVATCVECFALFAIAFEKRENRIQDAKLYGENLANAIELTLEDSIDSTKTLDYFYTLNEETCIKYFDGIASKIISENEMIDNLCIASKDDIKSIYPNTTIDVKKILNSKEVEDAIKIKQLSFAGPYEINGKNKLIIIDPISDEYVCSILDWDKFVENVLEHTSYTSIKYKYAIKNNNQLIISNTKDNVSNKVDIELDNNNWHLLVEPVDGWKVYKEMYTQIIFSVIATFMLIFIWWIVLNNEERKIKLREQLVQNEERDKNMFELSKALDDAKKANEAKTTFLNNVSHDIRTPMNAILGFTSLMEKEINNPEKIKEYIDKIEISGDHLLTLINNMLELARIDSGREELDISFMDLLDENKSVIPLLENEIQRKGIHFTREMNVQNRYIYADPQKLIEITINLLSNAIKYTPEGGSICMKFEEIPCEREGYATYVNSISDTGIGMSKEFQEHIFESFTRERNSTESKVMGTGLGMSIVKKLVDLMDGTIEIESEPGKGSCFKVTITHRLVENPKDYLQEKRDSIETTKASLKGKRILLAEDNELNAEIAISILEDADAQVEHVKDGVECVNVLMEREAHYYDLILMDIQMPNLNGYDATKQIRLLEDENKAKIPIIAMTANAFAEDKEKAKEAGMDGHLAKPIDVPKLMELIVQVLDIDTIEEQQSNRGTIDHINTIYNRLKNNTILSLMPGGFFAYEAIGDERLIYANKAACNIWGCDSFEELNELCKGTFKGMIHPDDYDQVEKTIWEQVDGSDQHNDRVVYRIIRKDGAVRWLDDYGHLEKDKKLGDIFYVFVADTTDKYE